MNISAEYFPIIVSVAVFLSLVLAIAGIVIYDAVTLRREVGFQSEILNRMIKKLHVKHRKKLKEILGHNVIEVIVGAACGYVLAYAVFHL